MAFCDTCGVFFSCIDVVSYLRGDSLFPPYLMSIHDTDILADVQTKGYKNNKIMSKVFCGVVYSIVLYKLHIAHICITAPTIRCGRKNNIVYF